MPRSFALLVGLLLVPAIARAADDSPFAGPGFRPLVPISAFARPASWLDPSRLHITTELSVGSGLAGRGTDALQVTRLGYEFGAPLAMSVSVGNAFGPAAARGNALFLEGLDLSYRPFNSLMIQVHYQDVRSPLQYGYARPFWR